MRTVLPANTSYSSPISRSSPTTSPGCSITCRTAIITPGMNDSRPTESWRIRSVSPGRAQDHLLVRDEAGQAHAVYRDAIHVPAACARDSLLLGRRPHEWLAASRRHPLRRRDRRPGGRVGLPFVVQLDDLGVIEVPGRRLAPGAA